MTRNLQRLAAAVGMLTLAWCGRCDGGSLLDPTFDPGTGANGIVETVLQQPDGRILVCGNFTEFDGATNSYIARLNADGSIDSNFVARVSYWVRTMALQSDGKIVIGGFFTSVGAVSRNLIARLNSDGSLDTSFDPGSGGSGTLGSSILGDPDPFVFATALQPDGKILITGNFTNYDGEIIYGFCRLNSDGTRDTNFNVGPALNFGSWGRSITVQTNGQIILTGWFTSYNNQNCNRMARINPDGSVDTAFNPYFGPLTAVYDSVELPNEEYIAVGDTETNTFTQKVARLENDGTFDNSFLGSDNDKTESVRLQRDGKILIGGYFGLVDGVTRTGIARLNSDGSVDTNFDVTLDNFVWSIDVQANSNILICGGFATVDGVSRNGVARLLSSAATTNGTGTNGGGTNGTAILTLTANGQGSILPKLDGRLLEIGKPYVVTAYPKPGYIFDGWTGGATNSSPTLRFVMSKGLTLEANFISNPYAVYTGTYEGLFYDSSAVSNATSGYLTLTTGSLGGYDARLVVGGIVHTWSGRFTPGLTATNTIMSRGQAFQVIFQLQNDNSVTGTVSDGSFTSTILGYKLTFNRLNRATNFAGFYNVLLRGGANGAPAGDGYISINVTTLGGVSMVGMLADGAAFSRTTILSPEGTVPFYTSYGAGAAAFGWINLATNSLEDAGTIYWAKAIPQGSNFTVSFTASGSRYFRQPGVAAVGWTNAIVTASLGNLAQVLSGSSTLSNSGRFVFATPNTNRFSITFNANRGLFTGSFLDSTTGRLTPFHGAILQDEASGGGFFISGGESGVVNIDNHISFALKQ